ncbi:hypothetical protein V1477_009838 [Vespula maculifrons]|uniref:Secreted protein n=1 Tax=Vespula maculifrons TaxID=7453 RepID=A0ABD2CAX7_VESMC
MNTYLLNFYWSLDFIFVSIGKLINRVDTDLNITIICNTDGVIIDRCITSRFLQCVCCDLRLILVSLRISANLRGLVV